MCNCQPIFKNPVDAPACREGFSVLKSRWEIEIKKEEKASRIDVSETEQ